MTAVPICESQRSFAYELLEDALFWLPAPIQQDLVGLGDSNDISRLKHPVETSHFLSIVLAIKEGNPTAAIDLISAAYDTSNYSAHLFLLRARAHFLLKEFEKMELCIRAASDLRGDADSIKATLEELLSLMERWVNESDEASEGLEISCLTSMDSVETLEDGEIETLEVVGFNLAEKDTVESIVSTKGNQLLIACCCGTESELSAKLASSTELPILATVGHPSIAHSYNALIKEAKNRGFRYLALCHQDLVFLSSDLKARVSKFFEDFPDTAVAGVIGARAVQNLKWWKGTKIGSLIEGRGPIPGYIEEHRGEPVDAIDGCVMVLDISRLPEDLWFDTAYPGYHAYDVDFCFTVRARTDKKVRIIDLPVYHATKGSSSPEEFGKHNKIFKEKWHQSDRVKIVQPDGYQFSEIFAPIASVITKLPKYHNGQTIVLGAHLNPSIIEENMTIFNMEQINNPYNFFYRDQYINLLKGRKFIDYHTGNLNFLNEKPNEYNLVPIPAIISRHHLFDIESVINNWKKKRSSGLRILFVGSMNARREKIINELKQVGWKIDAKTKIFGPALYSLYKNYDLVINIHFNIPSNIEILRITEALLSGCMVLTESSNSATKWGNYNDLRHIVIESDVDDFKKNLITIDREFSKIWEEKRANLLNHYLDWQSYFC